MIYDKKLKLKIAVIAVFLLIWEGVAALGIFSPLIFPSISGSLLWSVSNYEHLLCSTWATLQLLIVSVIISTIISVLLGGLASSSARIRSVLESFLSMFAPIPSTSLLPFALLWFGLGNNPIVFVTTFGAVSVFTMNVINGFTTVNTILLDVGRNYGLEWWKFVYYILIPSAFPDILTGFRNAWAVSWRTVIASELIFGAVGLTGGLGWVIYCQRFQFNPNGMMGALMCISFIGFVVEHIMGVIENRTVKKWGMKN